MTGIFSHATKRFLVVGSLLLVVAPLVFMLGHLLFNRWFLPTDHFRTWVVPVMVFFGVGWFALLLPVLVVVTAHEGKWLPWLLLPVAPFGGAVVGMGMLTGPVSHALHVMSSPVAVVHVERVTGVGPAVRWKEICGNRLVFASAAPHLSRELCGVSLEAVLAVKPGDEVALEGTRSPFGLSVTRLHWGEYEQAEGTR